MNQEEFIKILASMPEAQPVFYRLYYNEQGEPLFYSMEDLPGNYIEIDAEFYARSPRNLRVKGGKIIMNSVSQVRKLVPSTNGTACHPQDICVVVGEQTPNVKWSVRTHEQD